MSDHNSPDNNSWFDEAGLKAYEFFQSRGGMSGAIEAGRETLTTKSCWAGIGVGAAVGLVVATPMVLAFTTAAALATRNFVARKPDEPSTTAAPSDQPKP